MPLRACSVLLFALTMLNGCSDEFAPPDTVPVRGSVLRKGKAEFGVIVRFHPQFDIGDVDFIPSGETGYGGAFVLGTGAPDNGAPPGEYIVTLEKPRVESDKANSGIEIEVDEWKGKYSDPAKSPWKVTVQEGDNVIPPFEVE